MFTGLDGLRKAWAVFAAFFNSGISQHYNALASARSTLYQKVG